MKRSLLWFFGIIIPLQFILFFCLGKYLFFKETTVSFPLALKVEIKTYSNVINPDLVITIDRSTRYRIGINKEQEQCYRKNGYFIGYWYKMHLWWFVIYWIAIGVIFIHDVVVLMKMHCAYEKERKVGTRFVTCRNACPNCASQCDFYNTLDSYDATPIKNKFWRFWGY